MANISSKTQHRSWYLRVTKLASQSQASDFLRSAEWHTALMLFVSISTLARLQICEPDSSLTLDIWMYFLSIPALVISILTAFCRLVCENMLMHGEAAYTTMSRMTVKMQKERPQSIKKEGRSVNPFSQFFVRGLTQRPSTIAQFKDLHHGRLYVSLTCVLSSRTPQVTMFEATNYIR